MLCLPGRLALASCALWLGGCVEGAITTPAEPASAPAAGASGGGASALASGGTAPGVAGSGSGGASQGQLAGNSGVGGAMDCSSYADDATWRIRVHIENQMSETLYLGQVDQTCDIERLFRVEDGARRQLPSLDNCHSSCETMMQTGPTSCPEICAMPATVTLAPGQSLELPWDGRFGVEQTLPQQCLRGAVPSTTSCVRAEQVVAGPYTFSAQAGDKRQCLGASGVCDCTPNPNGGGCTSPASVITGTIYTTELFLAFEPGELSPAGESPYIGLVFKD